MFLTFASLCMSAAWVVWTWAYSAHHRPVPSAWTQIEAASIAAVLVWVMLFATGLGALVAVAAAPLVAVQEQTPATGAATLAAPVLAALAVKWLRQRSRLTPDDQAPDGGIVAK